MTTEKTSNRKQKKEVASQKSQKDRQEQQSLGITIPEAQHEAWYQLLRAHSRVNQWLEARLLRAEQIPLHWYDVLVTLEKAPGHRLRMSELADNVVTSRSNLSRLVDRLESEGLLRRETCPDDRRGSYAVLTKAGSQARLSAWPIVSRGIVELFASHVSDEEALMLIQVFRRVADNISARP